MASEGDAHPQVRENALSWPWPTPAEKADVFENEKSPNVFIGHGYTHSGHPVRAAAVLTCLAENRCLNLIENMAAGGTELFDGLCTLKERHEQIGDVRGGHGLMLAIECVSDRATKAADMVLPFRVQNLACENSAMVRAAGPNLLMSPPLALTSEDVQTIPAALDAGFAGRPETAAIRWMR